MTFLWCTFFLAYYTLSFSWSFFNDILYCDSFIYVFFWHARLWFFIKFLWHTILTSLWFFYGILSYDFFLWNFNDTINCEVFITYFTFSGLTIPCFFLFILYIFFAHYLMTYLCFIRFLIIWFLWHTKLGLFFHCVLYYDHTIPWHFYGIKYYDFSHDFPLKCLTHSDFVYLFIFYNTYSCHTFSWKIFSHIIQCHFQDFLFYYSKTFFDYFYIFILFLFLWHVILMSVFMTFITAYYTIDSDTFYDIFLWQRYF